MPETPDGLAANMLTDLLGEWHWTEILLELIVIGVLALGAYLVVGWFNAFVVRVYRGRGRWRSGVLRSAPLVRFAIFALVVVTIGSLLFELSTPLLLLAIVAFAVALGLGGVELMRNIISGAVIGLQRPFRVNDRIQVGELEGDILRIGIRSTSLRAGNGSIIHVPNRHFVSDVVVNSSLPEVGSPALVEIPLPPRVDVALAKDIAFRAACISKFASPRRRPQVRVRHNLQQLSTVAGQETALALEVLVYAFDPRYEEQLRGEVIELVSEGLGKLARDAAAPRPSTSSVEDG